VWWILYTVGFREVSGLNSFKNFKNLTTGCEDIAYCLVGYFIFSHPVRLALQKELASALSSVDTDQ